MNLLTNRQKEVAKYIAMGKSNDEIAKDLCISPNTVKQHISMICEKFSCNSRNEITAVYHRDKFNRLYSALSKHINPKTLDRIFDDVTT